MANSALSDRVLGQFPLSIATSLAIEGGLGVHPEHPSDDKPLLKYDLLWVNLKTLFRNIYNAVEREKVHSVSDKDFLEVLIQEVDQLDRVIASETQGRMQVVYYVSDYANMDITYKHAILRGDTTDLQKAYTRAMRDTLGPFVSQYRDQIKTYRLKITDGTHQKVLMLTHFAFDLLAQKDIPRLALIESHTGAVKEKHLWYTKYLNGNTLQTIPFMEGFMQVFGDKEHFRPWPSGSRKIILDLAEKYQWSQVTTLPKIRYGIQTIKDLYLRDVLLSILR